MITNQKAEGLRPQHPALPRFHYPLDEDLPRQALPQRVLLAAFVLDGDDAVEGPDLLDGEYAPRHEAVLPEVAQDRNVIVANLDDAYPLPRLCLAQRAELLGGQGAIGGGDGSPVRVTIGMAQELRQTLSKLVRDGVLEPLGFL